MANAREAVDRISEFLASQLSLEAFEDWSASYMQSVHGEGDSEAVAMASRVRSILNAYEDDSTEASLRAELEVAIRAFAEPSAENRYGDSSFVSESNAESEFNSFAAA